jgi:uncharacterized protein DUF4350
VAPVAGLGRLRPRTIAIWAALVAALIAGGITAVPDQDQDRGPDGTLAFRRFLKEMGLDLRESPEPPSPGKGTFVLLDDFRDQDSARELLEWVSSGGRLIVANPSSAIAAELDIGKPEPIAVIGSIRELVPACQQIDQAQVATVSVSSTDSYMVEVPEHFVRCFPVGRGSFLVSSTHGEGEVIVLGGRSPFTNRLLRRDDNALFTHRLFKGFGPIVLGPPIEQTGPLPSNPWDVLPDQAKAVVIEICLALAVFGAARGRRFGRPVSTEPVSPIPSSRLVAAVGELYRSAGTAGHAGRILRAASARRIARRVGLPGGTNFSDAVEAAKQALTERGVKTSAFESAGPENDEELIALAQELTDLEETVVSH